MKRIAPGYYAGTAIRKIDGKEVKVNVVQAGTPDLGNGYGQERSWYWEAFDGDVKFANAEDFIPTKRAAVALLNHFLENCYRDETWGWVLRYETKGES